MTMLKHPDKRLQDELQTRFYRWALKECEREAAEGLPFVRGVRGRLAEAAVMLMEELSLPERVSLLKGHVKRAYLGKPKSAPDRLTGDEERLVQLHLETTRAWIARSKGPFSWDRPNPLLTITKKGLRQTIAQRLSAEGVGDYDPWDLPNGWRHRLNFSGWTVDTHIDLSRVSGQQMWYYHTILLDDWPYQEFMSVLVWLGLVQTKWDLLSDADVPEAVNVLARACKHYIAALPEFLPTVDG